MRNNKILITGATGFVGKNLIREIIKKKKIRILVRSTSDIALFKDKREIEIVYGDLENNRGIIEALQNIELVIHCAARTTGRNFIEFYQTNTVGTQNLIRAMKVNGVKSIVYLSSHAACGPCLEKAPMCETAPARPISCYGRSKKLAEDIIKKSGIPYIILRPVSVYGPYDMEILKYVKLLNYGICPIVGGMEKYVNLIYVNDLVRLIIKIAEPAECNSRTYFVNDGNCYAYGEILNEIKKTLHKRSLNVYIPQAMALLFGLINDVFWSEKQRLVGRDKIRALCHAYWLCTSDNLRKDFGFAPEYMLSRGMAETINWYRENGLLK